MSEMVERVARAILDAGFEVPAHDIVVLAFKTMREPTTQMINEVIDPGDAIDGSGGLSEMQARCIWQAMIDEALK